MGELRDIFEKWYGNKHRSHRNKLKKVTDDKYDNSFIQLSYNSFTAGYNKAINTPKHETVEELREAYEKIKDSHTEYEGDYSTCIHCNEGGFGIIKHTDDCIVTKANRWLFKNGKPEIEG